MMMIIIIIIIINVKRGEICFKQLSKTPGQVSTRARVVKYAECFVLEVCLRLKHISQKPYMT